MLFIKKFIKIIKFRFLRGELKFQSVYSKKADFIVVDNQPALDDMKILSDYILKNTRFRSPQLLISVTGGAKNFTIDKKTKNAFMRGLVKAAKTTDSWIISGGTNVGVMRLVGDAIEKDINGESLPVIGVASYKRLDLTNLIKKLYDDENAENNKNIVVNEIIDFYCIK
jgi:hypothetical protein